MEMKYYKKTSNIFQLPFDLFFVISLQCSILCIVDMRVLASHEINSNGGTSYSP